MIKHDTQISSHAADDEVDLRELFIAICQGKWIIIVTSIVFMVASVFYALSLPNIYKSETLLAPAGEQKSSGLAGQLGGLAALAGVNLGSGAGVDKTTLALEIVKSRDFLSKFIEKNIKLEDLMAAKEWNMSDGSIIYDESIYDEKNDIWVRTVRPPKKSRPSSQEAHKAFLEVFNASQDPTTSMVKMSIEHISPSVANMWLTSIIRELNSEMKIRDIDESTRNIAYLDEQIGKTNYSEVKTALFSLIEEQTKTLMLANVSEEYVFKILDSPVVPEEKFKPRRTIIVLVTSFLGCLIGVLLALMINYRRKVG